MERSQNYDFSEEIMRTLYNPLGVGKLFDTPLSNLSGGELQRAFIAACLAKRADLYVIDEPSAYLDVEERLFIGNHYSHGRQRRPMLPPFVLNMTCKSLTPSLTASCSSQVRPGIHGRTIGPLAKREGMNVFLQTLDITFRRDPTTGRARINKKGSQMDQSQRAAGQWWGVED